MNWITMIMAMLLVPLVNAQISNWQPRGMGGGGGLFGPALSPHDAEEIYLACDMGEFFHSTDGGEYWQTLPSIEIMGGNRGQVAFTGNPDVLYALDGRNDQVRLSKSTDSGRFWTVLDSDPTSGDAYSLFADHRRTDRLLVSDYDHLYYSHNGGVSFSTAFTASGCYVAGAFFHGDSIYVGTKTGLLVSSNGGQTFSLLSIPGIPAGQSMIALAGGASGGVIRLLCLTADSDDVYPGINGADFGIYQGCYSLEIGHNAWVSRSGAIPANSQPFYLKMSRNSADVAWAAGHDGSTFAPLVLRTTNGGVSWSRVFHTYNNLNIRTGWCGYRGDVDWSWAECALGLAESASDPLRALITDYGFAHLTNDGGLTWKQIYLQTADENPAGSATPKWRFYRSNGLEPTSCWSLLWVDSLKLIASYSDIAGARSTDGGNSWARPAIDTTGSYSVNTIYHVVQDEITGRLYAATSSVHDLYQSTYLTDSRIDGGRGQLWMSADSGRNWQMIHNFLHPVIWLAFDPANPQRLLASVVHSTLGGIYQTTDLQNGAGASWIRLAAPPRTQGHPFNIKVLDDGTLVTTYSARRAGNPVQFTPSSGVFVSTNGGVSWLDRSDPMMLYWTKDLVVDPHDAAQNTWWVTVHRGWGGPPNELGGLFRTTDRGQSWMRVSNLLYAESCAISPVDSQEMYLSTETDGLWFCDNLRSAQPLFTRVAGYPFAHPLRVFYNPGDPHEVWLTSFGNGLRAGRRESLSPVNDLTVASVGDQIELRWSPTVGAQAYRIEAAISVEFLVPDSLGTTTELRFMISPDSTRRFFRVRSLED